MDMRVQQEMEAGQRLEEIYAKLAIYTFPHYVCGLTEDDLALVRHCFNITERKP